MRLYFQKSFELATPGSRVSYHGGQFYHVDDEERARQFIESGVARAAEPEEPATPAAVAHVPAELSPEDGA